MLTTVAIRSFAAALCLLLPTLSPPLRAQAAALPAARPTEADGAVRMRVVGGLENLGPYIHHEQPFWTRDLPARTKGRIQAEIVPSDRVGIHAQDALRLIQLGIVPFGTILLSQVAAQAPELSAPDLAGLNQDMAGLQHVVAAFRPQLQKTLREQYGVELLAVYADPAQMLFCKRPLAQLSDLKGRRVRTSNASQSDLVEALGGVAVRTGMSQIMAYARSGNIDCAIVGAMTGNAIGLHEITTDLYTLPLGWGLSVFAAHLPAWNALPRDVQATLREELPRLEAAIWVDSEKETAEGVDCNTGSPRCAGGHRGRMAAARASEHDDALRRELFASTVLARWVQRCGAACARAWEQSLAPVTGVNAPGR